MTIATFVDIYSPEEICSLQLWHPNELRHQYSFTSAALNALLYVNDILEIARVGGVVN